MPRDKTVSHVRVNKAIREEFIEKGFEKASVRSIGARAGMTSAGLYRHYKDKEAMFDSVVKPLVDKISEWTDRHIHTKYDMTRSGAGKDELFGETVIDLIKEVIVPNSEEFRILMNCSTGTRYENFIHDYAEANQKEFMKAMDYLREVGFPVKQISEAELHALLSAYLTACFEPIVHGQELDQIDQYLNTIQEFFMPGWFMIMGLK